MGTTYTATLNVQCLKQHTCVACDAQFSYLLTRDIKAEGATKDLAMQNAGNMAANSMANDVDFHPCPNCGMLQPEMTADVKSSWYTAGIVILLIVVGVSFFCGLAQGMRISTSAYVALIGAVGAILLFVRGALYNPNGNLQANLAAAQSSIDTKQLMLDEPKSNSPNLNLNIGGFQPGDLFGLVFGGLGLVALALPIILPTINGWHLNDSTYPAVMGPGDTTTFYFDSTIKSLKGYWNGPASVNVTNAKDLGIDANGFQAKTKKSDWGGSISGKSLSNNSNTMWAQVTAPAGLDLKGKKLDLELKVSAQYPFEVNRQFINDRKDFHHRTSAVLSGPGAGSAYYSSWLYGQIAGLILFIVASVCHFGTVSALKKKGNPTDVVTLGAGGEAADEEGLAGAGPDQELGHHDPEAGGFSGLAGDGLEGGLDDTGTNKPI